MNLDKPLRIMKFGGTSVGNASCIRKVADIIRAASAESDIVVVVSAMSGVTNKLIEAAVQSEAGHREAVESIFAQLRQRHETVVEDLIHSDAERKRIRQQMQMFFEEGERLCQGTILLGELTPERGIRYPVLASGFRLRWLRLCWRRAEWQASALRPRNWWSRIPTSEALSLRWI